MKSTIIPKRVVEKMKAYMELNEAFGARLLYINGEKYHGARIWRAVYLNTLYGDGRMEVVEVHISYNKILGKMEESVDDVMIPLEDARNALDAFDEENAKKHKVA